MTQPVAAPPSSEIGYVIPGTTANVPGWAYFGGNPAGSDQLEDVAELTWPNSVRTYHRMRTDSQIDALTRSVVMPLLRLNWRLKPNGARPEVLEDISTQLNLPILGDTSEYIVRGRPRFNHAEHLRMALLAPTAYGHMFFEMVGEVDDQLKWQLTKLAPRMPQTIRNITVEADGGLASISQYPTTSWTPKPIPVSQLVAYPWEKEGGNWFGRSMLRPLYKHWVIKDLLLRIDTMKNERYGLGVPVGTAAPGGDPNNMQKLASSIRASEAGGAGLPNGAKLGIQGVTGTLPDTLGSIRYQDEAMARSFLAMFLQLGQTETGSRALGQSFVDFFVDALAGFANWYANITTQHVINDIVDWNWGEDEQAPILVWEEREDKPLGIEELARLAQTGALLIDEELQNWIRQRYNMPTYIGAAPLPTRPGTPSQNPQSPGAEKGEIAPLDPTPGDPAAAPVHAGGKPSKGTPADKRLRENKKPRVTRAAAPHLGVGHRAPNEVEVRAATDFSKIQQDWQSSTDSVVTQWHGIRNQQIDALVQAAFDAASKGDATALATLQAPILGNDVILRHMIAMATMAIADANREAISQGQTAQDIAASSLGLEARADAIAAMMARDLSGSASRNAVLRYGTSGVDPAELSSGVRDQLNALTDAYLRDTLGGAMTQAQNTGRRAVMDAIGGTGTPMRIYASELLDENTCENCSLEDGTEFTSLSDSQQDYPAGGYVNCLGGPRCRGTLVAVYGESD